MADRSFTDYRRNTLHGWIRDEDADVWRDDFTPLRRFTRGISLLAAAVSLMDDVAVNETRTGPLEFTAAKRPPAPRLPPLARACARLSRPPPPHIGRRRGGDHEAPGDERLILGGRTTTSRQ